MQRIVWVGSALAGLLIVAAAVVIGLRDTTPDQAARPAAATAQPTTPSAASAPPSPTTAHAEKPPSFDIVSVDPRGQAVIAGRAAPGDRVKVLDGEKPLGEVTADARGEWVLVPNTPVPPGDRKLTVEATGRDGGPVRRSDDVVALSVTPPASRQDKASSLAVLLPGDAGAAPRVLQRPDAPGQAGQLALESADYGEQDRLVLSGRADPGSRLNVYAGDRLLGTATADAAGKWSLVSSYRRPAGAIELRLDQLAGDGSVALRVAAPLNLPAGVALKGGDTYVVQRGHSLWLIARQIYGQGMRYTAIYDANRDQIRDPDWIYPGQQFKMPKS